MSHNSVKIYIYTFIRSCDPFNGFHRLRRNCDPFNGFHRLRRNCDPFNGFHRLRRNCDLFNGFHRLRRNCDPFNGFRLDRVMSHNSVKIYIYTFIRSCATTGVDGRFCNICEILTDSA